MLHIPCLVLFFPHYLAVAYISLLPNQIFGSKGLLCTYVASKKGLTHS